MPAGKVLGRVPQPAGRVPPALDREHLRDELRRALARAIEALNRGAALAGALQNTGEGGIAAAHLHGGELVFQIGTGYFGCRDERGALQPRRAA